MNDDELISKELLNRTYFRHRGKGDCFGTSLANLLLLQGEDELAHHAYSAFYSHPLVLKNGTYSLLATRLVHDLTRGEYFGMSTLNYSPQNVQKNTERIYGDIASSVHDIVLEEQHAGRIKQESDVILYKPPALYFMEVGDKHHAMVDVGLLAIKGIETSVGLAIDNGDIGIFSYERQPPIGILEVRKW